MKKIILLTAAFMMVAVSAFAATAEELAASKNRIEKLIKTKAPEKVSLSNIDALGAKAATVKDNSINISKVLNKYYSLSIGEVPEGAEEGATAPTLEECQTLYKQIEEQTKEIGNSATMITKAADDVKSAKPLNKVKAAKSLDESKKIFTSVGEETVFQTTLITEIIANIGK